MSHAFFKALLFLSAGGIIMTFGGEHDIRKMGGIWRKRPVTFIAFLAGAASLAAFPLVTSGFYSKDLIISTALESGGTDGRLLWLAGTFGAFLTGIYSFRPLFIVFFGSTKSKLQGTPGWAMAVPMLVLSALALAGGLINVPALLGFLDATHGTHDSGGLGPELIVVGAGLLGILLAYIAFATGHTSVLPRWLERGAFAGLGFDRLYDWVLVQPFLAFTRAIRRDPVDWVFEGVGRIAAWTHRWLSATQTGRLRWYASATTLGGVLVVGAMLLLAVQS